MSFVLDNSADEDVYIDIDFFSEDEQNNRSLRLAFEASSFPSKYTDNYGIHEGILDHKIPQGISNIEVRIDGDDFQLYIDDFPDYVYPFRKASDFVSSFVKYSIQGNPSSDSISNIVVSTYKDESSSSTKSESSSDYKNSGSDVTSSGKKGG